jgi:hypothetical protein
MTTFTVGTDIFVYISNAMIYKTKVEDIRVTKYGVEYYVRNNSFDCPDMRWVSSQKCFLIGDINSILNLGKEPFIVYNSDKLV